VILRKHALINYLSHDIPSKLEQVQQLIAKIDIAVRQVLIEARIVEASDSFGKSLGVKLGGGGTAAASGDKPGIALGSSYVVVRQRQLPATL